MAVRIGILGAGQMGRTHAEVLARDGRARIVGVADADAERAKRLAADLGARPRADLEALLAEGIDLLIVATPNRYHAEASIQALQRGVGVLCEKPMAISLGEARAVCEAASRAGAFYTVGHNRRHAPVYRRVRALLREGFRPLLASLKMHEGDYRTPSWVADREISGGFLYENLVHFFDLMEWLVAPIAEISCLARGPLYPDLNDFVISVAFEGGAIGALTATGHASWLHPAERTELVGDHASIVVEGLDRVLHSPGDGVAIRIDDVSRLPREERWGYREQDAELIESYLAGRPACFPAARALRTLEIAEACAAAARDGRAVRLGPPPPD
ncbi:MAG TPA: Gfo/Idh/MocA family oxidoreductase [Candidatus Polarisedimenticolia bacterium]|nr:Gfo/Idh/MocA family oxidoreductase [Candidatus Polarisedimenticolia bacterium]